MAQVRWSLTAGNDLQDIEDFIARDSVLHAITFVDHIVAFTETLLKTPHIGISDASFPSSIVQICEKSFSGVTALSTSYKTARSLFFESCMVHEIFSHSSAENLGILEAEVAIPWRLG